MLLRGIQKALFDMALPYGFALAIWGSGTILTRSRGTPHVGDIFLGALGVVVAYGGLQFLGRRAEDPGDEQRGSAGRPILPSRRFLGLPCRRSPLPVPARWR